MVNFADVRIKSVCKILPVISYLISLPAIEVISRGEVCKSTFSMTSFCHTEPNLTGLQIEISTAALDLSFQGLALLIILNFL